MPEFTLGTIDDLITELEVEFSEIKEFETPVNGWSLPHCGGPVTNNCTGPDCQTW